MRRTRTSPNKPAAPNVGIALWFHSERHWPGVGEPERSMTSEWGSELKVTLGRGLAALACVCCSHGLFGQPLVPGQVTEIPFTNNDVAASLYNLTQGDSSPPCMSVRLPDDYRATGVYPLLVYLPGLDGEAGGRCGRIAVAQELVGNRGWITVSLPLFKQTVDTNEYRNGRLVSFEDYPTIAKAYRIMLGRLSDLVPNIDRQQSGMVGFSNGALTIAVLISCGDEFVLTHFKNFVLVDHGMFHLGDLRKRRLDDCRILLLVGGARDEEPGRRIVLRQSANVADLAQLLHVNLRRVVMEDAGHDFPSKYKSFVGRWLRSEIVIEPNGAANGSQPGRPETNRSSSAAGSRR